MDEQQVAEAEQEELEEGSKRMKLKEEIKGNCHLDPVAILLQFLDTHPHSSEEQHREAESESQSQQSQSTFKTKQV